MEMEGVIRQMADNGKPPSIPPATTQTSTSAVPNKPSSPSNSSERPKDATLSSSGETDIFEPPVDFEDPEYMPLVHLWLDLPANLKRNDIGDPVDLYRERLAIIG